MPTLELASNQNKPTFPAQGLVAKIATYCIGVHIHNAGSG